MATTIIEDERNGTSKSYGYQRASASQGIVQCLIERQKSYYYGSVVIFTDKMVAGGSFALYLGGGSDYLSHCICGNGLRYGLRFRHASSSFFLSQSHTIGWKGT